MSLGQRIVATVALGLALAAAGAYVVRVGGSPDSGWIGYAPLTGSVHYPHQGLPGWLRLLVWLGLILIWAAVSAAILRPARGQRPTQGQHDPDGT